jgi:drug/metabolite transporter (DMT)-like permease
MNRGTILCLASAAAFGAAAVFGKLAFDAGAGVVMLLFVRFALAALVFWVALGFRRELPRPARRTLLVALGLGAVGYTTQSGLFFAALTRMDASLLSLVLYTYPVFVTVAAIALGRETPSRKRLGALLVASSGVVLVLAGSSGGGFDLLGAAMGVGAALTYTGYILVSDKVSADLEPLSLSALVTTGAAVTIGLGGAMTGSLDTGFEPAGWLWLALIALVSTVGAVAMFFGGMKRVGPSNAAILSTFEPPVTVALAFVTFGEALTALQLAGAALVLGAVIALNLRTAPAATA